MEAGVRQSNPPFVEPIHVQDLNTVVSAGLPRLFSCSDSPLVQKAIAW